MWEAAVGVSRALIVSASLQGLFGGRTGTALVEVSCGEMEVMEVVAVAREETVNYPGEFLMRDS